MRIADFGQPRIEALAEAMLSRFRAAGSFLFEGPAGVGKEAFAVELGRLLNCEAEGSCPPRAEFRRDAVAAKPAAASRTAGHGAAARAKTPPAPSAGEARCSSCRKFDRLQHPDLLLVFPTPRDTWDESVPKSKTDEIKLTTLGQILQAKAADPYHKPDFDRPTNIQAEVLRDHVLPKVQQRPVEGRFKVIVLSDADQMAHDIGNVLLKTLEEPPADCVLVLTTTVPQRLLPTIVSRCQRMQFAPLAPDWMEPRLQSLHGAAPAQARLAAAASQGSMLLATRFLEGSLQELRDRAFTLLEAAAGGDLLVLLENAQSLAQEGSKRRTLVPLLLRMLGVLARDTLLMVEKVAKDLQALVNADRAADLQKLARSYDAASLHAIVRGAEIAERQVAGHASVEHTLAAFFTRIGAGAGTSTGATMPSRTTAVAGRR